MPVETTQGTPPHAMNVAEWITLAGLILVVIEYATLGTWLLLRRVF